ncbi:heme exporter protein CcmD [Methylocella sp.]|uniref:heme exporter protein CcmD n=1 Tax=Methylocella sp. TaxID=1978226 RepID=UPI003C284728
MTADPHFGFVVVAYAIAFVIVAAMIFAILRDYFALRQALSRFPAGERRAAREGETAP